MVLLPACDPGLRRLTRRGCPREGSKHQPSDTGPSGRLLHRWVRRAYTATNANSIPTTPRPTVRAFRAIEERHRLGPRQHLLQSGLVGTHKWRRIRRRRQDLQEPLRHAVGGRQMTAEDQFGFHATDLV